MSEARIIRGVDASAFLDRHAALLLTRLAEGARDAAQTSMGGPGPNPPSEPGQPPHRQTSQLHANVTAAVDTAAGTAQTVSTRPDGSPEVPGWLEFGTRRAEARPYMRPAYEKVRAGLARTVDDAAREAAT